MNNIEIQVINIAKNYVKKGKEISLQSTNLTKNKPINNLYTKFLKFYKVPKYYLENLINDKQFTYYNTKEQQKDYVNKWSLKCV